MKSLNNPITRWFKTKDIGKYIGILNLSWLFGDAISRGYLALWLLLIKKNWEILFYVAGSTAAALTILEIFFLKDSPAEVGLIIQDEVIFDDIIEDESQTQSKNLVQKIKDLLLPVVSSARFWLLLVTYTGLALLR